MENYSATVDRVRKLLTQDTEWTERYSGYITELNDDKLKAFKNAQKQFNFPASFHLYMPLGTAVNDCSSVTTFFELRFHGQSAAKVKVGIGEHTDVSVSAKANANILNALKTAGMSKDAENLEAYSQKGYFDWHSNDAADFRRIYSELEKIIQSNPSLKKELGQPEHDMECELLKNYSQKSSDGKEILNIQPVMMGETSARFQMPTPLTASQAKKGPEYIEYAKEYGGGIDILARVGKGKSTELAVLELKDSYSNDEPAEKVMHQAVAYAVFLRELLRSECGEKWWKFFGFGRDIPEKLVIKAVVVMPYYAGAETDFGGTELPIENDVIKLGYIYRTDDPANQKICI